MAARSAIGDIEDYPEADCLEGFLHPRLTPQAFGHDSVEAEFADAFRNERMHHAWLLCGGQGIGKATLAYRLARMVLSGDLPEGASGAVDQQVGALSHPGLLVIRRTYDLKAKRFKTSIPVDEVRRLRGFLSHRSGSGSWRVVIVDSADELNINAANALLKSLEEPPARTVFLLISAEPGRLLATLRSRCRRIELAPLSEKDLRRAFDQACTHAKSAGGMLNDATSWSRLVELSHGSVRRALALHSGGGLELSEAIAGLVSRLPDVDWPSVHKLADGLQPISAKEDFDLFFELLSDQIVQGVRSAATGQASAGAVPQGLKVADTTQLASWAALWETLSREKADVDALNLDRKTFILETVARLKAATASSQF